MSTILPVALGSPPSPTAMPIQASELSGLNAALARDNAIADLPALSASVNQLQSLSVPAGASSASSASLTALPAPALPAPQLQPPTSTDPLKQDYFSDGDAAGGDSTPAI